MENLLFYVGLSEIGYASGAGNGLFCGLDFTQVYKV